MIVTNGFIEVLTKSVLVWIRAHEQLIFSLCLYVTFEVCLGQAMLSLEIVLS